MEPLTVASFIPIMASATMPAIFIQTSQDQEIQASQSHNLLYLGRSNAQQLNPLPNCHPRGSDEQQVNPPQNCHPTSPQNSALVEPTDTFHNQPH
jgi:hypothetical protein